jgi:uncharacterized membrane protein YccC
MQSSQLPLWMQYVQALGPTVVAIVVGLVAGHIAWRQWRTANHRLRLDLFEKRYAVYEAIKNVIGHVQLHGQITADELGGFYAAVRGAEFLFKGKTRNFITKISDAAFRARMVTFARERQGDRASEAVIDREEDLLDVLRSAEQQLEQLFSRYLDLSKVGL